MTINIITPLTRPGNLIDINNSIVDRPSGIKVKWHIIIDKIIADTIRVPIDLVFSEHIIWYESDESAIAGHAHRNRAFGYINEPDEWVMSLDDDNIIHPALWEWLSKWRLFEGGADGIIWDQIHKSGNQRLIANRDEVKVYNIDTAQYMIKRRLIGDTRLREDKYEADGIFIQELYERNKDSFIIVNEPLCYYNYLRS